MVSDTLLSIPGTLCVQLIGSRLCGYHNSTSDVDLLVYVYPGFDATGLKKRTALTNGLMCHWEFVECDKIIPPSDRGPKWKHFGAQQFVKLSNENIVCANTEDGKLFAEILLKYKDMISRCGAEIIWEKFGSKIKESIISNPSPALVVQSLISLSILTSSDVDMETLCRIKSELIPTSSFIDKIKASQIDLSTRLQPNTINQLIYNDFLTERNNSYGT